MGKIRISPVRFQPSRAADLVKIKFSSSCSDSEIVGKEIVCKDVTVSQVFDFTAEIELDKDICTLNGPIRFDLSIFGQSHSTLNFEIGNDWMDYTEFH